MRSKARVMGGFIPQKMNRVELLDPPWIDHEEPILVEQTLIPAHPGKS